MELIGAIFLEEGWGWDRHSEAQSRSQVGVSTGELLFSSQESPGVEPDLYISPWEHHPRWEDLDTDFPVIPDQLC